MCVCAGGRAGVRATGVLTTSSLIPRFFEFLELANENVMYEINLTLKTCKRIPMRRPWRAYGIPPNATFETEYYVGGPGEEVFAQEWSDRIPMRQRECSCRSLKSLDT